MQWNLIRLRKEAGLTQENMAKILNVNVTTYQNKETGKTHFYSDEMFAIRDYFKLPIEQIFLPSDSIVNGIGERMEV